MTDPIADRRQRAREAYDDCYVQDFDPLDTAIEVATQVKITAEMLDAMNPAVGNREARLRAAFRAAGFEVVE